MRIAVISVHGCPCIQPGGTDAGGMNVYVDAVYARMARMGHQVVVYSRWHTDAGQDGSRSSYELIHVPVGELDRPKSQLSDVLSEFSSMVAAYVARDGLAFDLLASHYWLSGVVGCELASAWSIPHVVSFHTLASIKKRVRPEEEEPEIRFVEERRVAREADLVIAWTKGEAQFIEAEMGLALTDLTVVAPGVDTDFFHPKESSQIGKAQIGKAKNLLYVGRLDALKGVDLLIDVFSVIVQRGIDAELQVIGGGSADEFRRVLGRIAKLRLSDRVRLPGVLPQSELATYYSDAVCIIAPSFHETFGLAVLEAASCGTPAVAADVDGLRAIVVDGETGFLIGSRQPEIYAEKIIEICEDEARQRQMSYAARVHATSLSWDAAVANLIDVYVGVLQTRHAARNFGDNLRTEMTHLTSKGLE